VQKIEKKEKGERRKKNGGGKGKKKGVGSGRKLLYKCVNVKIGTTSSIKNLGMGSSVQKKNENTTDCGGKHWEPVELEELKKGAHIHEEEGLSLGKKKGATRSWIGSLGGGSENL